VGSEAPKGDGLWNQTDLAGNVNEWTLDGFANYETPCSDCTNLTSIEKVARGGGYFDGTAILRTGVRGHVSPSARFTNVGVRCARAL
jgi:formylglycine-generating enzyme required for sulfatase activity